MPNPGQQTALNEFLEWELQSRVEVVADKGTGEKVHFMPLQNVKSYFTANDGRKLNKILTEVFKSKYPPVDADLVLREHTAVFCILLHMGQGNLIEHFVCYEELSDRRLPFDAIHPPREFPALDEDPNILRLFCEEQTAYCVPVFDSHMVHKRFGEQRLLPIRSRRSYGPPGVANQYVVTIYGPHNKLLPPGSNTQNPYSNTFVLKTYSKDSEAQYKQEVDGFRTVRHAESVIKFYGSFIHGDEFNVLLEYPDKGSLEEYFKRESPPSRGPDIIKFWEGLFLLIKGLKAIHSVRLGHHDVRPKSIVVVSSGEDSPTEWQFKFADVGISSAKTGDAPNKSALVNDNDNCSTYGPPETYSPNHDDRAEKRSSKITWSADIWALGCIYSEAAMWIADGYKGLLDYRQQRTAESDRILFKGGDCFHDGERVLKSVLDAHIDIQDRLRRSDHITKDVLDTMVDEMLWDEDRPNAKALWRKAEMVLARARQRLTMNSADEFSRPSSSQSRALSLPRSAPPTAPLPAIPRAAQSALSSISETQYPPNVEKWRAQVGQLQISTGSRSSGPVSSIASPTFPSQQTVSTESVSEFERDTRESMASWNFGDNASSIASPVTQFSSPHISLQADFNKQIPNEGRPRVLQRQSSNEYRPHPRKPHSQSPYTTSSSPSLSSTFMLPPPLSEHPAYSQSTVLPAPEQKWATSSVISDTRPSQPASFVEEHRPHMQLPSRANSRQSTVSSNNSEPPLRPKSSKRNGGFSLFPSRNWNSQRRSLEKTHTHNDDVPRSAIRSSMSSSTPSLPPLPDQPQTPSFEYLSLNTCLEWKKAHKKVKKNTKVPPLPGAHMLEDLDNRDHIFIVDDSASMAPVWHDVKRVFETLSYVVKGMSPQGTELFYTVSYDTYRRKDTSDLCDFLENKTCKGETNISYRLGLQLQAYRLKIALAKGKKGKEAIVRPMSFYILTNGEWGEGADPKISIQTTADFLIAEGLTSQSQVTIEFISFATTAVAMQKINDLAQMDFGLDIVDCTRWTGNVLKMLKGPWDKNLFDHDSPTTRNSHGLAVPPLRPSESSNSLVYARDVINELA